MKTVLLMPALLMVVAFPCREARAQAAGNGTLSGLTLNAPAPGGSGGAASGAARSGSERSGAAKVQACARYGAGFVQVPGTNSCVRTDYAIRMDVGVGRPLPNAPGAGFGNAPMGSAYDPPTASDPWRTTR